MNNYVLSMHIYSINDVYIHAHACMYNYNYYSMQEFSRVHIFAIWLEEPSEEMFAVV